MCTYCDNFKLTTIAAVGCSEEDLSAQSIVELSICTRNSEDCLSGDCEQRPGPDALTEHSLGIPDDQEIDFAIRKSEGLLRMTLPAADFIEVHEQRICSFANYNYVRKAQWEAIQMERCNATPGHVVFEFDFSENRTAILSKALPNYLWHKSQVPVYTYVVTASTGARCYAMICDSYITEIQKHIDEHGPFCGSAVTISYGASAHFKNRLQHLETGRNYTVKRCLFSAPRRGKNVYKRVLANMRQLYTISAPRPPRRYRTVLILLPRCQEMLKT